MLAYNHYFFSSSEKVNVLCQPFFKKGLFSFFDYARFYENSYFCGLSVNSDSLRIFFELEYESLKIFKNLVLINNNFYYLLTPSITDLEGKDSYIFKSICKIMGADHGFIILRKKIDYVEVFCFSNKLPRHLAINYYFNQLPTLTQFISYFQARAHQLLREANENKIILPEIMRPKIWKACKENSIFDHSLTNKLSKREIECITYISKGYTNKEIANLLALSSRTIEIYVDNIKKKLNIQRKSELIRYLLNYATASL